MRFGKPTKNRKHRDPRYFLNEQDEFEDMPLEDPAMAEVSPEEEDPFQAEVSPEEEDPRWDPITAGSELTRLGSKTGALRAEAALADRIQELIDTDQASMAGRLFGDALMRMGFTEWPEQLRATTSAYLEGEKVQ